MNDERGIIICSLKDQPSVRNSVVDICSDCGTAIMISPTGRRLIYSRDLRPVCLKCANLIAQRSNTFTVEPPTPEQLTEFMDHFLPDAQR